MRTTTSLKHSFVPIAALVAACAGGPRAPERASDPRRLAEPLSAAFVEEAHGDPRKAIDRYLDLVDAAAASPESDWSVAVASAALDALVARSVGALGSISADAGLVYRTEDPSLTRGETMAAEEHASGSIVSRLAAAYEKRGGAVVRGLIAASMTEIAEHRGEAAAASRWREAMGCAREATVVGPVDWAPVAGLLRPDVLSAFDARVAPSYPSPGAFAVPLSPVVVRGRGCSIDLSAASSNPGVRDVVVDVTVKHAGRVALMLRSSATATLRAGGKVVIDRPYELGGANVTRFAWVVASPGVLRLVARVGMDQEGENVRVAAWDAEGRPLPLRAPRPGEAGTVEVTEGDAIGYPSPKTPAEELTVALAALAAEDPRSAEYLLEHDATQADALAELALAYGRAVENARDLSLAHRVERARSAYERVLAVWPDAWEAVLAHAWLTGAGHGPTDARFAELEDLDKLEAHGAGKRPSAVDLFDLVASGREHLWDRVKAVDARVAPVLGRSALYAEASRIALERSPADLAAYDCGPHRGEARPRSGLDCYDSLRGAGDVRGAMIELERVRAVLGGVDLLLPLTMRDALVLGDARDADRALSDMLPAEATLSGVYGVASLDPARGVPALETKGRLLAVVPTAHDAPIAVAPLMHALGVDPSAEFAGVAEAAVAEDRARPVLPGAATAILRHVERYDVSRDGVVHAVVFDLRRISGTSDVEDNAQASAPALTGRTSLRILRRRILKRDGTIVEPDPNPSASQGHADLAQLEAGDVVEAIYEGWSVPIETGEIGIDTPDLLPGRTAVHQASVEIHLPATLKVALWSHAILGAPRRDAVGGETVLRWSLADHVARRVEDATPKMERSVAVSLSTATWGEVGRGLREAVLERVEHDPAVLAWARDVVRDAKAETDGAKVDAIVLAAGKVVREGDPGDMSDLLYGHATGPQSTTARAILSDHEGSRTWLITRALSELGVPCEVAVAENDPWSSSADFPPHLGRFVHPLGIAHVKGASGASDVFIDADVSGPPLPAGHLSPELRGRQALHEDGSIAPLPMAEADDERDEIDERLTLDARGDARGTFTIVLRGRDAQDLAEVLLRNVGEPRQKALRGVVLAWLPRANVEGVELSSTEGSWQVAVRANVSVAGYAQPDGPTTAAGATWMLPGIDPIHDVYPKGSASTLSATYASEGARESALAVTRAVLYHARRTVTLPPGANVVKLPPPFEVHTGPLVASRALRVNAGGVLEDEVSLGVATGTLPASAYAGFVAEAHRTDDALLSTVRVRVPAGKP